MKLDFSRATFKTDENYHYLRVEVFGLWTPFIRIVCKNNPYFIHLDSSSGPESDRMVEFTKLWKEEWERLDG